MESQTQELYFDPFAEEGEQYFDPLEAFQNIENNYIEGKVTHDYSADDFVKDTEALMLDTAFVERFEALEQIAMRMHDLCGDEANADLIIAAQDSEVINAINETYLDLNTKNKEETTNKHNKSSKKKRKLPVLAYLITPHSEE